MLPLPLLVPSLLQELTPLQQLFLNQSTLQISQTEGTRWAAIVGYASDCCDLHLWPINLISMSLSPSTCDLILVKLAPIVTTILYFWGHCLPWPWPWVTFWPKNLISTN